MADVVRIAPEVAAALRDGAPVVALESSVLAQGLPEPANREAAERMVSAVRARGAVPAITAVVAGVPAVGLTEAELGRFLARAGVVKLSARDIPLAMARGADGATTVAATLVLAHAAGIAVFATGGIGGVHREDGPPGAVRDESADLLELARTPMVVVCSGAKSILDLEGTMERLETLGVPVAGYRTSELPGFFTTATGIGLPARLESPAEVAGAYRAQRALGRRQSLVVAQPPPEAYALTRSVVDAAVVAGLERARAQRVRGGAVTPFLLTEVQRVTAGKSIGANLALLESNAALAAEVALELARGRAVGDDTERGERPRQAAGRQGGNG
jgi:pseudouridine-5'-phosphate glycosidase